MSHHYLMPSLALALSFATLTACADEPVADRWPYPPPQAGDADEPEDRDAGDDSADGEPEALPDAPAEQQADTDAEPTTFGDALADVHINRAVDEVTLIAVDGDAYEIGRLHVRYEDQAVWLEAVYPDGGGWVALDAQKRKQVIDHAATLTHDELMARANEVLTAVDEQAPPEWRQCGTAAAAALVTCAQAAIEGAVFYGCPETSTAAACGCLPAFASDYADAC